MNVKPTRIAIVGAGGNAREIAAIVRDITDAGWVALIHPNDCACQPNFALVLLIFNGQS